MNDASDAATVVLVIALALPALGAVVPLILLLDPDPARRWTEVTTAAAALAWLGLLVSGEEPHAGIIRADALVAAAGIGTALLALAARPPARAAPAVGAAVSLLMAGLAVETGDRPSAVGATAGLAVALAICTLTPPRRWLIVAGVGTGILAAGVVAIHAHDDTWVLGAGTGRLGLALVAVGAGLVVAGSAIGAAGGSRLMTVPLAGALAIGVRALAAAPRDTALSIGLAAAATALAVAATMFGPRLGLAATPGAVLGLWALAAAVAVPDESARSASLLIGSAAVLVAVLRTPAALGAAVPGAVALAVALASSSGARPVALGVLLAVTAALLVRGKRDRASAGFAPAQMGAGVLAAWLVLAPSTWGWIDAGDLGPYADSVPVALAAAGMVVVAATAVHIRTGDPPAGAAAES